MADRKGAVSSFSQTSRRQFLRVIAAGASAVFVPLGCSTEPPATRSLTEPESRLLAAFADHVLPPDDAPGGAGLGVVDYVEGLLTAFDSDPPRLFAGGPFSGRVPFPDADGNPSSSFPENQLQHFIALSRTQELGWRLRILGSAGVSGGGPNDAVLGPIVGLRDQLRSGLGAALARLPDPAAALSAEGTADLWAGLSDEFTQLLIDLTVEAAFAVPEYGGNRELLGWRIANFAGDSQPRGYTTYDPVRGVFRERPEAPVFSAEPSDPEPLGADNRALLASFIKLVGGSEF